MNLIFCFQRLLLHGSYPVGWYTHRPPVYSVYAMHRMRVGGPVSANIRWFSSNAWLRVVRWSAFKDGASYLLRLTYRYAKSRFIGWGNFMVTYWQGELAVVFGVEGGRRLQRSDSLRKVTIASNICKGRLWRPRGSPLLIRYCCAWH